MKRKNQKSKSPKGKRLSKESYGTVEEWYEAPDKFRSILLKDGEYTVIIDPNTGAGLYLVARLRNTVRYHAYLDGGVKFNDDFKKVTPLELSERAKEKENFL